MDLSARESNICNFHLLFLLYSFLFRYTIFYLLKGEAQVKNLVMLRSELTSPTFALKNNAKIRLVCVVLTHSSLTHFLVCPPKYEGLRCAKYQKLLLVWKSLVDFSSMPACLLCCWTYLRSLHSILQQEAPQLYKLHFLYCQMHVHTHVL